MMDEKKKELLMPLPYGDWVTTLMEREVSKAGIVLPSDVENHMEATGRESLRVILVGPDCKWVKKGHIIRPHGLVGTMKVDGVEYRIVSEKNCSCHIGVAGKDDVVHPDPTLGDK